MGWTKLSGKGKVYGRTVFRLPYHDACRNRVPYVVAIIQLHAGPRTEGILILSDPE